MIKEIRLENARVFEGRDWKFPLSGLTILCGTNSAGKSTILKSLLLLKQNIVARPDTSAKGMKLRFAGQQVDLGNFQSFVSHQDVSRELMIGVSFTNVLTSRSLVQLGESATLRTRPDGSFAPIRYQMHCDFRFGAARQGPQLSLDRLEKPDVDSDLSTSPIHEAFLREATFKVEDFLGKPLFSYNLRYHHPTPKEPSKYVLELPRAFLDAAEIARLNQEQEAENDVITVQTILRGLLPDRLTAGIRPDESPIDPVEELFSRHLPMPDVIDETLNDLRRALNFLAYIGPLRAPAERYYMGLPDYNLGTDTTGKFLPHLLRERQDVFVEFAAPVSLEPMKMTLGLALDFWLYYLRTGNVPEGNTFRKEFNVGSSQDILVELNIRSQNGEEVHALADSGFGYSQLLPILARGLLLQSTASIAIEQPEVHLNPALQARLGEFLICVANSSKQVIIETHSEHIVNYLRARTAEAEAFSIEGGCMILYMEAGQRLPKIHNLCVADDGSIPAWPPSFFGEGPALSARILRAQRKHRHQKLEEL